MRANQASGTAILVAAARAIATRVEAASCNPQDAAAEALLPAPLRGLATALAAVDRRSPRLARWALSSTGGLIDHVALRAGMIDAAVSQALSGGCQQVVILGAGLDTRAQRLPGLAGLPVFELDHPASQAHKRARLGPAATPNLHYLPVDLTRSPIGEALDASPYRRELPSLWLWEGVIPYLSRDQVVGSLAQIGAYTAPGSQLVASYRPPGADWPRRVGLFAMATLPLFGEWLGDTLSPTDMGEMLSAHGFRVAWDRAPASWFEQVGRGHAPRLYDYERLVCALRD